MAGTHTYQGANTGSSAAGSTELVPQIITAGVSPSAGGQMFACDTTTAPFTVTLPSAPAEGTQVGAKLIAQSGSNAVTIAASGTDRFNYTGGATSETLQYLNQGILLQYHAGTVGVWYVLTDDFPLTALDTRYGLVASLHTTLFTAAPGQFCACDATSTSPTLTATLPDAPADGAQVAVKMIATSGTNTVTVACSGSDKFNRTGGGTSMVLSLVNQGIWLVYRASSATWYVASDDLPLSQLDLRYAALAGATFTGYTAPAVVTLTDAATVTVNAAAGNHFRLLTTSGIGATRQLGTPAGPGERAAHHRRGHPGISWRPGADVLLGLRVRDDVPDADADRRREQAGLPVLYV